MGSEAAAIKDTIARSLEATDDAVDVIREGEFVRRQIALELRDLQLTMNEDFETMKNSMEKFEKNIYDERQQSGKWMNEILSEAKAEADRAVKSRVLLRDVQLLEKKVDILQDSVINVNHSYAQYEDQVDIGDLKQQVVEMAYRTQNKERELIQHYKGNDFEQNVEIILRGAIESLLGLQISSPKILAEAKELAAELRGFRDAAANKNLFSLIGKQPGGEQNLTEDNTTEADEKSISEQSILTPTEKFENGSSERDYQNKTTLTPLTTSFLSSKSGKSSASPFIDVNASSTPTSSAYSTRSSGSSSKSSKKSKSSSHVTI